MGSLSALNERFAHASTHSSEAFSNYHQTSFVSPAQLKTSARRLQLYRLLRGGSFSVSQSSLPFLAVRRRGMYGYGCGWILRDNKAIVHATRQRMLISRGPSDLRESRVIHKPDWIPVEQRQCVRTALRQRIGCRESHPTPTKPSAIERTALI